MKNLNIFGLLISLLGLICGTAAIVTLFFAYAETPKNQLLYTILIVLGLTALCGFGVIGFLIPLMTRNAESGGSIWQEIISASSNDED